MSFYNGRGAEALESRKDNDNYTATTSSSSEEKVDYNKRIFLGQRVNLQSLFLNQKNYTDI